MSDQSFCLNDHSTWGSELDLKISRLLFVDDFFLLWRYDLSGWRKLSLVLVFYKTIFALHTCNDKNSTSRVC